MATEKELIDLNSPNGNAFYLLGKAEEYMRKDGYTKAEILSVLDHMQAHDYKHLLKVFRQHCSDHAILV